MIQWLKNLFGRKDSIPRWTVDETPIPEYIPSRNRLFVQAIDRFVAHENLDCRLGVLTNPYTTRFVLAGSKGEIKYELGHDRVMADTIGRFAYALVTDYVLLPSNPPSGFDSDSVVSPPGEGVV